MRPYRKEAAFMLPRAQMVDRTSLGIWTNERI